MINGNKKMHFKKCRISEQPSANIDIYINDVLAAVADTNFT